LGYIYASWCGLCEHFGGILGVSMAEKPLQTAFFPEVRTSFCHFEPPGANFGNIFSDYDYRLVRHFSAVRPTLRNQSPKTWRSKLKKVAKKRHLNQDISPKTTKIFTKPLIFSKLKV